MIAIPAVDLREGACVQLVGGSYADERVRLADPLAVARNWQDIGFRRLHVVDLDASLSVGDNTTVISGLLRQSAVKVQVGGGVRTTEHVAALLETGANRVVVGTRAIEDRVWLEELVALYPERIIVAADVRDRSIVTHGWSRTAAPDILEFIRSLESLALAGLLVTAVHLEGQMKGTDLPLMSEVVAGTPLPVIASGGVTTIADLRSLDAIGVAGAVIGMALYTGALDARLVAEEFNG